MTILSIARTYYPLRSDLKISNFQKEAKTALFMIATTIAIVVVIVIIGPVFLSFFFFSN